MTFWTLISQAAAESPERTILADDHGRSMTTVQFRDAAERVAAGLDLRPGDPVSWQLPTSLEAVVLMAALTRLGVIQNPIVPALRERECRTIVSQVQPKLYVAPKRWGGFEFGAMARSLGCRVLEVDLEGDVGSAIRLPMADPSILPLASRADGQWIYYSSGTTAEPKGVRHDDASIIAGAAGLIEIAGFGEGDVYPIAWPISHIGGVNMLTTSLLAGMKLILFDAWNPRTTPERMAAHAPTILGSAQPFFRAYLDAQRIHGSDRLFPSLRLFTAGGAPTPPEIARELGDVFGVSGVVGAYGLTEFPIATTASPDDDVDVLLRSVGRVPSGVCVRIVDGEIRLKGPQCFHGYVDAALDREAFDEEGWFRTGDLGEIDSDGNLFVTGRSKEVVIRNAENISVLEIEDVLLRHPAIEDVAVVGLPDARTGERLCAVIVTSPDAPLDLATLVAHCVDEGLAKYKCPEQIEAVPALERNAMGKLVRQKIREAVLES